MATETPAGGPLEARISRAEPKTDASAASEPATGNFPYVPDLDNPVAAFHLVFCFVSSLTL